MLIRRLRDPVISSLLTGLEIQIKNELKNAERDLKKGGKGAGRRGEVINRTAQHSRCVVPSVDSVNKFRLTTGILFTVSDVSISIHFTPA